MDLGPRAGFVVRTNGLGLLVLGKIGHQTGLVIWRRSLLEMLEVQQLVGASWGDGRHCWLLASSSKRDIPLPDIHDIRTVAGIKTDS